MASGQLAKHKLRHSAIILKCRLVCLFDMMSMPIFNTHATVFRRVCRYPPSLTKTDNLIATHLGDSMNQEASPIFF